MLLSPIPQSNKITLFPNTYSLKMNRLTRPLNSVRSGELLIRSLSLQASFTRSPYPFSRAIRPLGIGFPIFASIVNRCNYSPELPAELDAQSGDDVSERRNVEKLSKNLVVLTCDSSAEGGKCHVYVVGTSHVSRESCREVEAVISYLKPQVVFLELCSSRASALTRKTPLKVPSTKEMLAMWKKNRDMFAIFCIWFTAEVGTRLGVIPGSEFRVAYEEANKYGGKVVLGDRPIHITFRRIREKTSLWNTTKLLYSVLSQPGSLGDLGDLNKMLKDLDDVDKRTRVTQEMSEKFPFLMKPLVDERDQFMSTTLLEVASKHSSVVAVVGKGHLHGIRKYWKQPVSLNDLMTIPPQKTTVSTGKILGIGTAGVALISGIYLASKM